MILDMMTYSIIIVVALLSLAVILLAWSPHNRQDSNDK
jgi:cbb3-type cytochrome oxidase subunit 3